MNGDYDDILDALLAHLKDTVPLGRYFSRRLKMWTDVSAQPAIFVRHTADEDSWQNPVFATTTLKAEIWIYDNTGKDAHAVPDAGLNAVVSQIRAALRPSNPAFEAFTLGGLAQYCRIEGEAVFDPGDISGQGIAVLPVSILLP